MQEQYLQRLLNAAPLHGPWLCPYELRRDHLRFQTITPSDISPGRLLVVKCRLLSDEYLPVRLRSPVEICRVRAEQPLPSEDDCGELTLIPVEFLFADRYGHPNKHLIQSTCTTIFVRKHMLTP